MLGFSHTGHDPLTIHCRHCHQQSDLAGTYARPCCSGSALDRATKAIGDTPAAIRDEGDLYRTVNQLRSAITELTTAVAALRQERAA